MNKQRWSGIIAWGIFVTCVGLCAMSPARIVTNSFAYAAPDQEVIFLLAGGMVTCLIGFIGMVGVMGWIPGFDQKSRLATG